MATGIDVLEDVIDIAEHVNSSLKDPFEVEGPRLDVTASIGTSFYSQDGTPCRNSCAQPMKRCSRRSSIDPPMSTDE